MAFECTLLVETELTIPITCADGTQIPKGRVLKLADPATVSASSGTNDVVGGIAASEKIADDGFVKTDVYRGGIWKGTASGSITNGDSLGTTVTGQLVSQRVITGLSGSRIVGTAWEDATDLQTFKFELRPQNINSLA